MQRRVDAQRHCAVGYLVAHLLQFLSLSILIVLAPFGKVQVLTPLIYVISNEPGDGREVRVPRPDCLVGMTIAARAIQNGGNLGRHLRARVNRLRFVDRRVSPRRSFELGHDEKTGRD